MKVLKVFTILSIVVLSVSCASRVKVDDSRAAVDFEPLELNPKIDSNYLRIDVSNGYFFYSDLTIPTDVMTIDLGDLTTKECNPELYKPLVMDLGNGLCVDTNFNFYLDPIEITGKKEVSSVSTKKMEYKKNDNACSTKVKGFNKNYFFYEEDDKLYNSDSSGKKKKCLIDYVDGEYIYKEYGLLGLPTEFKMFDEGGSYSYRHIEDNLHISANITEYILNNNKIHIIHRDNSTTASFELERHGNEISIIQSNTDSNIINPSFYSVKVYRYKDGYIIRDVFGNGAEVFVENGKVSVKKYELSTTHYLPKITKYEIIVK